MARERKIQTRADGTLFYELNRSRTIPVPGTRGLQVSDHVEVPQLPTEGDVDEILQMALNMVEGKDDSERVEKLATIINAGLVADAQTAMQTKLMRKLNESQVVSDFSNIVTLTKSMLPDLDDGERAQAILEKFPEIAKRLEDAGLSLATDEEPEESEDEE